MRYAALKATEYQCTADSFLPGANSAHLSICASELDLGSSESTRISALDIHHPSWLAYFVS